MKNLLATIDGWEYWLLNEDVYRVRQGNRGYMLPEGVPANVRWEMPLTHFETRFGSLSQPSKSL